MEISPATPTLFAVRSPDRDSAHILSEQQPEHYDSFCRLLRSVFLGREVSLAHAAGAAAAIARTMDDGGSNVTESLGASEICYAEEKVVWHLLDGRLIGRGGLRRLQHCGQALK